MFKHFTNFALTLLLVMLLTTSVSFAEQPIDSLEVETEAQYEIVKAKVLSIKDQEIPEEQIDLVATSQLVKVEILDEPYEGKILEVVHETSAYQANSLSISVGDKVLLHLDIDEDGSIKEGYISDFSRNSYLILLVLLFILCLIAIGRIKGLKAVLTLFLTVVAIIKILVPAILQGKDPVWITILVAIVVSGITLFVIAGINKKSLAALMGTAGGVIMAGICASGFIALARFTGLGEEEAQMLQYLPQEIHFNFQGLLFAGMIIGALGAIMDVGISIASSVAEVNKANPNLSRLELTKAGMNVGRDIIGTMSNTLILAYSGGALPLLLLIDAYEQPWFSMINMEMIAVEVVRALSGSIGLILAVPLTALVSASLFKQKSPRKRKELLNCDEDRITLN